MRLKAFAIASLLAFSTLIAALPLAASAGMMDESMFVGTWQRDGGSGDPFFIEWSDDGTGREWYEDSSGSAYSEYDFTWKLEDGQYMVSFDDGSSWWEYDYDFSSTYDELTLSDSYGTETYTREGLPGTGCCCCCCGWFLILPAGAFALVATAVMAGRRRR